MEMTMTKFTFASDESGLILIDAETQAEAEAKLLAEPSLIGVSNIRDFEVSFRSFHPSFRAPVPDRHARSHSDKIIPWSSIVQIVLAYKGRAR
jgi:hypothetical protein